jgi:tRNA G18 (ribose-2'-O)-methylase SpoU
LVAVPMRGQVDSLDVPAAASAAMYGILHFRESGVDSAP